MEYLLYHPRSRPGGRIMAEALGVEAGVTVRDRDFDVLIRWGSQRFANTMVPLELNPPHALALASDKLRAFGEMHAAGVTVPPFGYAASQASNWLSQGHSVLGRTRRGFGGIGITIYKPGQDVGAEHEMYVQFIPSEREYRLHVVGDEVVRVQRKQVAESGRETNPIRNYKNGYRFVGITSQRLHSNRYEAALGAVRALGLDFGAVDMLIGMDDRPYVLEVNTAPACSPLTASVYAAALRRLIDGRA